MELGFTSITKHYNIKKIEYKMGILVGIYIFHCEKF